MRSRRKLERRKLIFSSPCEMAPGMNRRNLVVAIIASFAMFALSGCSTIVHGTSQDVIVNTVPQGATVSAGSETCISPCRIRVEKKAAAIKVAKQGYDTKIVVPETRTHAATMIAGNIPTLFLGTIVDAVNGSRLALLPVEVVLVPEGDYHPAVEK